MYRLPLTPLSMLSPSKAYAPHVQRPVHLLALYHNLLVTKQRIYETSNENIAGK